MFNGGRWRPRAHAPPRPHRRKEGEERSSGPAAARPRGAACGVRRAACGVCAHAGAHAARDTDIVTSWPSCPHLRDATIYKKSLKKINELHYQ